MIVSSDKRGQSRLWRSTDASFVGVLDDANLEFPAAEVFDELAPMLRSRPLRQACSCSVDAVSDLVIGELGVETAIKTDSLTSENNCADEDQGVHSSTLVHLDCGGLRNNVPPC